MILLLLLTSCVTKSGLNPEQEVLDEELLGILITPEDVLIPVGDEIQLTATGLLADRTSRDITAAVDWSTSNQSVASVSGGLDREGVIAGLSVGTSEIEASLGGVSSVPLKVKVSDAQLLALNVTPTQVAVGVGDSAQLTANATFSDGSLSDASAQVRWITKEGSVATVEGGLVTGAGAGTTEIVANWDGTESNKVGVQVTEAAAPDLDILSMDAVGGDGVVLAEVVLSNKGTAGASAFWMDGFLDPSAPPTVGQYGDEYLFVDYIGPDESRTFYYSFEGVSDGTHEVWAYADSEGILDEESESNNSDSVSVTVESETVLGPELVIDKIDHLHDETSIYYFVEISNYSDAASGPFYVDLWLDRSSQPSAPAEGDYYQSVDGISGWSSVTVEFLINDTCNDCTSWVLTDSSNDVDEQDEGNNALSVSVDTIEDTGFTW